jgi:hypothetical protein
MAKCQELWRNVRRYYGRMSGAMAECQDLLWRNFRTYYGVMSGVVGECQELL